MTLLANNKATNQDDKEFQNLIDIHKNFHFQAAECIAYCEIGDYLKADEKRDEFYKTSKEIISYLNKLKISQKN